MLTAARTRGRLRRAHIGALSIAAVFLVGADRFDRLPESSDARAREIAVVFDFDKDSCYPSPAVSREGKQNPGLKTSGSITGECREPSQLLNSNTYYRKRCITRGGINYCVHMYALYFKKDQLISHLGGGHRHDWEFALVWTTNDRITHASYSAHGKVTTKPVTELHFDRGREKNVKIVYHKDGGSTHAMRFAKRAEAAENHLRRWVTPPLVDWDTMRTDRISNQALRDLFNRLNWGSANCSFNDVNFPKEIAKTPPPGYPF